MAPIGEATVVIKADTSEFKSALEDLEITIHSLMKHVTSLVEQFGTSIEEATKAIVSLREVINSQE